MLVRSSGFALICRKVPRTGNDRESFHAFTPTQETRSTLTRARVESTDAPLAQAANHRGDTLGVAAIPAVPPGANVFAVRTTIPDRSA